MNQRDNNDAGLAARNQLIDVALDLFGQLGYNTVSVRQICDAAGMNVASINYHFGSKAGLYLAVATYIRDNLNQHLQSIAPDIQAFLASGSMDKAQAMQHLLNVCDSISDILIPDSVETERWARFITRFQLGDDVPDHDLSKHAVANMLSCLVAILREDQQDHFTNSAVGLMIFGQILVFRANRVSSKETLGIKEINEQHLKTLKGIIRANVKAMLGSATLGGKSS